MLVSTKPTTRGGILHTAKALFSRIGKRAIDRSLQADSAMHVGMPSNSKFIHRLVAWEHGELSEAETLTFFQELVSSGLAWKSTGPAHRTAMRLIREGLIHR
jgi:hypothetical protein